MQNYIVRPRKRGQFNVNVIDSDLPFIVHEPTEREAVAALHKNLEPTEHKVWIIRTGTRRYLATIDPYVLMTLKRTKVANHRVDMI